ncbi:MAG: hypothetical protein ACOX3S_04475 [Anaerolineae bacterium]|jgi:hypothetical protein
MRACRPTWPASDARGGRLRRCGARGRGWRWALAGALLLTCALAGCRHTEPALEAAIRRGARGLRFSIARWELQQLSIPRGARANGLAGLDEAARSALVRSYADLVRAHQAAERELERLLAAPAPDPARTAALRAERDRLAASLAELRPQVQAIVAAQVRAAYRTERIYNPLDRHLRLPLSFPPLAFTVEPLPHVLVVSPRDRIDTIREVLLAPDLTVEQMEAIEAQVEAAGYSALVVELGGLGATYPTFVHETANLRWLITSVAEEWLHQYLAFTPAGWRYLLDELRLRPDYGIARLNESAATIVSEEVALRVLAAHYPELALLPPAPAAQQASPAAPPEPAPREPDAFDFNREMRITRLRVDELLAAGDIDAAEAYMEERRLYMLTAGGYALRKLNQAYFAFHGAYAVPTWDAAPLPPELADPLGADLERLRAQSGSLAAFLDAVAGLRSADELPRLLD